MTIRILHVIGAMDCGGAETFIMNVYRALDTSKIQFDFLVHEERECDYDAEILERGGKIFHLPRFDGANYFEYRALCREHFYTHPEHGIVHGHIGSSAGIYLDEAKNAGRYTIAHSHGSNYETGLNKIAFAALTFSTRAIADWFFACSMEAGVNRYGNEVMNGPHATIVKNGINLADFTYSEADRARIRSELSLTNEPVYCHVGRLTPVKNHEFLLKIFASILQKQSNAVLLLVGRGELEEALKERAAEMGIAHAVHFLGVRSDIASILSASDTFIFPSLSEGLPVSTIEAQANGLPVFMSDGVSSLALACSNARQLPLAIGPEAWADAILNAPVPDRSLAAAEVQAAGFDIKQTAQLLSDFYLKRASGLEIKE